MADEDEDCVHDLKVLEREDRGQHGRTEDGRGREVDDGTDQRARVGAEVAGEVAAAPWCSIAEGGKIHGRRDLRTNSSSSSFMANTVQVRMETIIR
jgi:hypothetical protein